MNTASQKEIEKKNSEAELIQIKSEINDKALELAGILQKVDKAQSVFALLNKEKAEFAEYKAQEEALIVNGRKDLDLARQQWLKERDTHSALMDHSKREIKSTLKELARLNEACIKAQDEFKALGEEMSLLQSKIEENKHYASKLEEDKVAFETFSQKREDFEVDLINRLAAAHEQIAQAKIEYEAVKAETDKKVVEMNEAQYKLKTYTDELYTHMNDYQIIRARLETTFKEHYPELELPLAR